MKLSTLKQRLERARSRVRELDEIKRTHHMKRPDEYRGKAKDDEPSGADRLKAELTTAKNEVVGLKRILDGGWYENDERENER